MENLNDRRNIDVLEHYFIKILDMLEGVFRILANIYGWAFLSKVVNPLQPGVAFLYPLKTENL